MGVEAADVGGDGDIDILAASTSLDDIAWGIKDGTPGGGDWTERSIDGDGDLDLVGGAVNGDDVSWWENDGSPGGAGWTEVLIDGSWVPMEFPKNRSSGISPTITVSGL